MTKKYGHELWTNEETFNFHLVRMLLGDIQWILENTEEIKPIKNHGSNPGGCIR